MIKKFYGLAGLNKDGELISKIGIKLGWKMLRGSSSKGGSKIFVKIVKILRKPSSLVGITPDGPKGPREKIKDGLISLIKKTDAVIIPLSYSAKIKIRLRTWDKFLLIFPFNKFIAVWGTPFKYNARVSFDKNKAILQKEFQRIESLSKNLSL